MSHLWYNILQNISLLVLCLLLGTVRSTPQRAANQTPPESTQGIPLSSLVTSFPLSLTPQGPSAQDQIRNTLAHYPLAIDGKNFAALNLVFTADAVANYSAPLNVLNGLKAIETTLELNLRPVLSQHALSTQVIEISTGGKSAKSVTYYTASHFGQGAKVGKVCQ